METETIKKTRTRKTPPSIEPDSFNWGKREFGIIAKSFEGEPEHVQNTMIAISVLLQVIKPNLNEQPVVVAYLINKTDPELSEVAVIGNLQLGLEGISHINYPEDLPGILTTIGERLSGRTIVQYNTFWDGMFKAIAAPLTQWEKVCIYAPYVYNVLVKPVIK